MLLEYLLEPKFLVVINISKIMKNWVDTQLELFDKTGWTNNGPTGLEHTGVMEVTHEVVLMISAWQKESGKATRKSFMKLLEML